MPDSSKTDLRKQISDLEAKLAHLMANQERDAVMAKVANSRLGQVEAMLGIVPVGVLLTDKNGQITLGNSAVEVMLLHPVLHSADVHSYGEWVSFHADGRRVESHEYPLAKIISGPENNAEIDVHYQRGDGSRFWLRIIGQLILDTKGNKIGAVVALVDVDTEYDLVRQQKVLIGELNHRVKNAFSVVKSIVSQSLRKDEIPAGVRKTIDERLNAYAAAHAKLVGSDLDHADLGGMVTDIVVKMAAGQVRCEGPTVSLPSRQALAISMALYELTANAVKYGALSSADGMIDLIWRTDGGDDPQLYLDWVERNGPPAVEPSQAGFGSFIIDRALVMKTDGDVTISYEDNGFAWHLVMPLDQEQGIDMTAKKKRVFIVEDEVLVAFEMTDTLQDMGFEVVGPSVHLAAAQKKAKTSDIDVAFLDVNLGRGQTSEPIAQILRERSIPFVYITAYERSQIKFVEDSDMLLQKPVSSSQILAVLRKVLPELDS